MALPKVRRFLPAAVDLATAIAVTGLLGLAAPAVAQDDPFALPRDVTIAAARQAEGPGLTPISVDGRAMPRLVRLKWIGTDLAIEAPAAEAAGLPVAAETTGWVLLRTLHLANWKFDRLNQHLAVKLFRHGDGPNDIDLARQQREPGERSNLAALLVDYDLSATLSARGRSAGAMLAPRLVLGNVQLRAAGQFTSNPADGTNHAVRLDSAAQFALPGMAVVGTLGDHISAGSGSQRPLRMGGVQIGSDFALRPDLITAPLPAFAGSVAVPTGIDLVVNDQRLATQDVEAGDFQLRNIPISPGRGEFAVVVRDALGRETIQSAQVYVSHDMLAPGLWQYGANMGWVRRRFGVVSNDYADLASSFFLRRGLSRGLSAGVSGEAGLGLWNFGAEAQVTVAGAAMVFVEARVSHSATGSGHLLRTGVESYGRGLSGRFEMVLPSSKYRDLAAQAGDPQVERQINAMMGFDLRTHARLQVTASRRWRAFDPRYPTQDRRVDIARATLRGQLRSNIDLFGDVSWRHSPRENALAAMVGLSIRLGAKRSVQADVTRRNGEIRAQSVLSRPDVVPGDIGYRVEASTGAETRAAAALAWRSRFTRIQGEVEHARGAGAVRGNARGTLIVAGGRVFARSQSGNAYALVSTGHVAGVTVTREHAPVGMTDRSGLLLVENVTPLVPVQFDIDPDKLPLEAVARSTYRRIVAARGGVARVRLDVSAFRSLPVRLTGPGSEPLPIGLVLVGRTTGTRYMVGYDGLIDFNALSEDRALAPADGSWAGCAVEIPRDVATIEGQLDLRTSCAAQLLAQK